MRTIGFNQELHFENVISRYYVVSSNEMAEAFQDFLTTVIELGYTPTSGFFYSINSDIRQDTEIVLQTFLPVEELNKNDLPEEYRYQSYFQVNQMLATRIVGEDEHDFSVGLEELISKIIEADLTICTPSFYLVSQIEDKVYTDVMIGVKG